MNDHIKKINRIENDNFFPLIYHNQSQHNNFNYIEWLNKNCNKILNELTVYGAILFKNFKIDDILSFDKFISSFKLPNFPYKESLSNAVRLNRTERIFTANEAPCDISIDLHHELAQTPIYPSKLFFYCEKAADYGGYTPICRSDILFERLISTIPDFIKNCIQKGVRYTHVMPPRMDSQSGQGRNWKSTLSVSGKLEAEEKLNKLNYKWTWLDDDYLEVTTPILSSVKKMKDGRKVFFNQIIAAFNGWDRKNNNKNKPVCFGDLSEINKKDIEIANNIINDIVYDIKWQNGDIAMINNLFIMHGRRSFRGSRSILASLIK